MLVVSSEAQLVLTFVKSLQKNAGMKRGLELTIATMSDFAVYWSPGHGSTDHDHHLVSFIDTSSSF